MRTRTSNLLIRSQMLYPIELWLLDEKANVAATSWVVKSFDVR